MSGEYQAPKIAPVPPGDGRPEWSVIIPTYNCARYLRQTLETVLAQDPGPEQMQIEVIDDCSTEDNPEAIVREVAGSRVTFFRRDKNGGANANFNTCIERSRGHFVHILHGDDYIAPRFYESAGKIAQQHPDAGIIIIRSFMVDEEGGIEYLSERLTAATNLFHSIPEQHYTNGIFTPGVIVRRSAYEAHGGFIPSLTHIADWEMWDRLIYLTGGVFVNEPLAYYRFFSQNETGRLARTADNLRESLKLANIFGSRHADFNRRRFEERLAERAWKQYRRFQELGDTEAAEANYRLWHQLHRKNVPALRRAILDLKMAMRSKMTSITSGIVA